MDKAVVQYLLQDTDVAALVGERVFWTVRRQGAAVPAIVLNLIDDVPVYDDAGEAGISESRLQVDVYAGDYEDAKALARAVQARLSGAQFTALGAEIQTAEKDGERTLFERSHGGDELHGVSMDFLIWHSQA